MFSIKGSPQITGIAKRGGTAPRQRKWAQIFNYDNEEKRRTTSFHEKKNECFEGRGAERNRQIVNRKKRTLI